MTIRHLTAGVAVLAVCALQACGGGGGTSSLPRTSGSTPTPTPVPSGTAQLAEQFTITVPTASGTSAHLRLPRYVSPNTGSVRIAVQSVNGATVTLTPTIAALAANAPGCATGSGGALVCTISAAAAIGQDVFAISTFQSSNGSGTALATTTVAETVTATSAAPVALSLGGVPASIAFSPSVLPLVDDGAIHRYAVTLDALDASGATIVGAGPYASSIGLQIFSDPTHALSLSTASVTQPGTVVTVTFDASKQLVNGAIQATGTGVSATLTAAPLSVAPQPLLVYDDASSGVAATLTQAGFTGSFTATVANAADASVSIAGGPLQSGSAVATIVPHTTFDVTQLQIGNGAFTAPVTLTVAPHPGSYAGYGSDHRLLQPYGLVESPDGKLWTADDGQGQLTSFDPVAKTYTSYTVAAPFAGPYAVAFDAQGNAWFAAGSSVGELTPSTSNVATYTTGLEANANVTGIVAGPTGTMWFYDQGLNQPPLNVGQPSWLGSINTGSGAIVEYQTPDAATPANPFGQPMMSMVLGPDNGIWFADGGNDAVGRLDVAAGSYVVTPVSTPAFPDQSPLQLVNGPDGNVWFDSYSNAGTSTIGSIAPATKTVQLITGGVPAGAYGAAALGSDHNLWFAELPGSGFFSSYADVTVVNPTTRAVYTYANLIPQSSVIAGLVDRGDRTLWMLDNAYGQIGAVPFK
ncbi:MAG TPA: hypothetical protein VMD91_15730 [Candidatus Sulfotelmatobacter sp.]|nr:hypothetical protein [Candidatus Sulfotelmatobacter sp.]